MLVINVSSYLYLMTFGYREFYYFCCRAYQSLRENVLTRIEDLLMISVSIYYFYRVIRWCNCGVPPCLFSFFFPVRRMFFQERLALQCKQIVLRHSLTYSYILIKLALQLIVSKKNIVYPDCSISVSAIYKDCVLIFHNANFGYNKHSICLSELEMKDTTDHILSVFFPNAHLKNDCKGKLRIKRQRR